MYNIEEVKKNKEFQIAMSQSSKALIVVGKLEIKTSDDEQKGIEIGSKITKAEKMIKEQEKKWTEGAKDYISTVKSLIKPKLDTLKQAKDILNSAMRTYRRKCEEEIEKLKAKEEKKIQKAMDNNKPIPVTKNITIDKTVKSDAGKVTYRTIKKYKIIDEKKIPRDFLVPDIGKINKACQADIPINGIEYYTEKSIVY